MLSPFDEAKYNALLDGLEAVEISFSEVLKEDILRLESSFWSAKNDKNIQTVKGEVIIELAQYGTSKELNEDNIGYLTLRINEFENIFITTPSKSCSLLNNDDFESLKLRTGDVLISRTNGNPNLVGKAAVVMEDTNFVYASYLFKIRPKKEIINAETLTVFINSKYGRNEVNKYSMTSNQTNFSPAKFREIDVPVFSFTLQKHIETLVKSAHEKLEESKKLYREAEELLLGELGLKDFEPSRDSVAVKSFAASFGASGRLDAEYYQPKYDEIISKIKSYKGGFEPLNKACKLHDTNFAPSDNEIYKYIELSNIGSNGEIKDCMLEIGAELPTRARRKVKSGQLVVSSIEGSLQSIAIVGGEYDNALCSTGFYVVSSKSMNSETLLVLLKNEAMQAVLKKGCSGTILTAIVKDEFLNIPLPLIDDKIQKTITEKINKSFKLRTESKNLLEQAKKAVEDAIEKGETK